MPGYGDGFLAAALQHFSYNSEQVIHALLEGALPTELTSLDMQMPLQLPSQQARKGSKQNPRDNEKGKLSSRPCTFACKTDSLETSQVCKCVPCPMQ